MGFKTKISTLIVFLLLVLDFQNCSPNSSPISFIDGANHLNNTVDSGTPYEGKLYVVTGNLCPDGIEIHSRIVLSNSTQAQLNRDNCLDIAPVQLRSNDFQMSPDSGSLTYKNQTFTFIGFSPLGITNFSISNDITNFYYGYTYEGQPSWLQIFLDTDNDPTTGFSVNGIGADYMIENDNVWKYSAPPGSPQNTWAWTSIVSANKNNVPPNISWSFARTAIGSPALIKVVAHTSLGSQTAVVIQVPK